MKLSVNTPEGTRDRLFAECMGRRQVQERLIRLFRQRGYREVSTPETEFYDLFARSGSAIPQEQMVQVFDQSGKLCVMRPDSTTPIARVAATKLRALPLPQRLYYDQTVYRAGPAHSGGNRELPQCGVELIGAAGMKADLEMVATAVDALRVCGASRFHVELGHAGFFRDVAARMELEEGEMERMRALIEGKNFAALRDMLAPFRENPASAALLRLSRLFGGPEVLDEAEALAGETEASEPCTGNCPRRDTARWSALTWGWSTRSTTILAWSSGAMWREQGMRCCLADATTRWWGYSAGRPRPPALP